MKKLSIFLLIYTLTITLNGQRQSYNQETRDNGQDIQKLYQDDHLGEITFFIHSLKASYKSWNSDILKAIGKVYIVQLLHGEIYHQKQPIDNNNIISRQIHNNSLVSRWDIKDLNVTFYDANNMKKIVKNDIDFSKDTVFIINLSHNYLLDFLAQEQEIMLVMAELGFFKKRPYIDKAVNIVGHGMGGITALISATYGYGNYKRVITLNSPIQGSSLHSILAKSSGNHAIEYVKDSVYYQLASWSYGLNQLTDYQHYNDLRSDVYFIGTSEDGIINTYSQLAMGLFTNVLDKQINRTLFSLQPNSNTRINKHIKHAIEQRKNDFMELADKYNKKIEFISYNGSDCQQKSIFECGFHTSVTKEKVFLNKVIKIIKGDK